MTQQRLMGQSALQAFRQDIIPGEPDPTRDDQSAVLVATLLRQSLAAADESGALPLREKAFAIARESLGAEALAEGGTYDDFPAESPSDVIRLLSQRTDRAGRLHLAQHLLESMAEIETNPLDAGRILAERARVSRKLGLLDVSFEQCQQLIRIGRELRSPELTVMGHLSVGAVAQTRGNYAAYRAKLLTGIRMARAAGLTRLLASATSGLGTSSSLLGRYGDAVGHYWRAYELCGGKGYIARAAMGNLGQTLLVSGRPVEARKVVMMVLQIAPVGTQMPMLGTFAIASAQLGDAAGVRWAAAQLNHFARGKGHAVELAEALMECSAALKAISEHSAADAMQRRSEEMAKRYGFHGLTFNEALQSVQRLAEPHPLSGAATEATAAINEIEVPRISDLTAMLPG